MINGDTITLPLGDALKLAVALVKLRRQGEFYTALQMPAEFVPYDDPDDEDDRNASVPLALRPAPPLSTSVLSGLPVAGRVTSRFGMRFHPLHNDWRPHQGIDVAAPLGTPVLSTGAGTVAFVGWHHGYGKTVIIDHGAGMQTLYAHLSAAHVARGDRVAGGALIGEVGSTGNSTGPHCHYELRRDGTPIDPLG